MTAGKRVLVVEDEFLIASVITDMVTDLGMSVCGVADNVETAIELALQHKPDVVLMDVRLRGRLDGVDAALVIHRELGGPVVFMTGSEEPANIARINTAHPAAILIKPFSFEQLTDTLECICTKT
jgi:AmiR/NasT family two-component response regulator